jgi:hypothetical protein
MLINAIGAFKRTAKSAIKCPYRNWRPTPRGESRKSSRTKGRGNTPLANDTQQLLLKNEFALLVFLAGLVCLVILPPYRFLALPASDIANDVSASSHIAIDGLALRDVNDVVEEICLSMLPSEVL